MGKVELECTLDRVETIRKKEGVVGKVVIVWDVRDFTKITKLSQMQNAVVKVLIEDPQQELFDKTVASAQDELEFFEDGSESINQEDDQNPTDDVQRMLPEATWQTDGEDSVPVESE